MAQKKQHKKKLSSKTWEFYEAKGELKRLKTSCPKCGPGVYLAGHKDRLTCGKCGYMEKKAKE